MDTNYSEEQLMLEHALLETQAALETAARYRQALVSGALLAFSVDMMSGYITEVYAATFDRPVAAGPYIHWLHQDALRLSADSRAPYLAAFSSLHDSTVFEYPYGSLYLRQSVIVTGSSALVIVRDITVERQFQAGMQDVYSMFSLLETHTSDISILLDGVTGTVEYISPNIEWLLGTSEPRIWCDASRHIYLDSLLLTEADFLPVTNPRTHVSYRIRVRMNHVVEPGLDIYIVVLSDMTQIYEQQEQLRKANAAKSDFLSRMSHDIRTPLNAIIGMNRIATAALGEAGAVVIAGAADHPKDGALDLTRARDALSKISVSSTHLLSLINDVLDMSRIESGQVALNAVPFSLQEMVSSLPLLVNGSFSMECNVLHDAVVGDSIRMTQILTNLLSNAIKYTPEGSVHLSVQEADGADGAAYESTARSTACYEFICQDTGIGMAPEFLEHLFEPFSREQDSRTSKIQGTGLGMSIVKNLVSLMGGTISVSSEVGVGTTVTVRIPMKTATPMVATENNKTEAEDFTGVSALLVEDNELNREIAEDLLTILGFTVEAVEDGAQAVPQADAHDVIFMDIQMPVMNGYEAARAIRAAGIETPIIAMTANAYTEDVQAALDAGMNAHVAKPLDMDVLRHVAGNILR